MDGNTLAWINERLAINLALQSTELSDARIAQAIYHNAATRTVRSHTKASDDELTTCPTYGAAHDLRIVRDCHRSAAESIQEAHAVIRQQQRSRDQLELTLRTLRELTNR